MSQNSLHILPVVRCWLKKLPQNKNFGRKSLFVFNLCQFADITQWQFWLLFHDFFTWTGFLVTQSRTSEGKRLYFLRCIFYRTDMKKMPKKAVFGNLPANQGVRNFFKKHIFFHNGLTIFKTLEGTNLNISLDKELTFCTSNESGSVGRLQNWFVANSDIRNQWAGGIRVT